MKYKEWNRLYLRFMEIRQDHFYEIMLADITDDDEDRTYHLQNAEGAVEMSAYIRVLLSEGVTE